IAADILNGLRLPQGILPVTVNKQFPVGFGVQSKVMPVVSLLPGMDMSKLLAIDTIATEAISKRATPGMVVLVAKDGKIAYHKAFGYYTYDNSEPVTAESIFDMASVTKICATTISIMKLYDEGKLSLEDEIGKYIPWLRGTDKERITVRNILLHQAGLKSFIPFYRETIDTSTGIPKSGFYSKIPTAAFSLRVSDSMYLKTAWRDTIYKRIANSPLTLPAKMIYSDNDFIFLGLIVEAISGMTLHDYAKKNFYDPMGLVTTGFRPRDRLPLSQIVPTENEKIFRRQLIRGDVHDPGAALFGGIAGHAGLFSNAYDLAVIMQMLMNKGVMNGKRYLSDTTIARFTTYGSEISHRALGFDKPYKDNATRQTAYPAASASPLTFGHTGFTGIGAWADPEHNLIFLVLSNRVHPDGSNVFLNLNVRPRMHEAVYQSLRN
ncbi:MAG: serine hydrolase domain-containing protein, partial [Chitinophagaceae bacterium]